VYIQIFELDLFGVFLPLKALARILLGVGVQKETRILVCPSKLQPLISRCLSGKLANSAKVSAVFCLSEIKS
jgi:hypothetical protein